MRAHASISSLKGGVKEKGLVVASYIVNDPHLFCQYIYWHLFNSCELAQVSRAMSPFLRSAPTGPAFGPITTAGAATHPMDVVCDNFLE